MPAHFDIGETVFAAKRQLKEDVEVGDVCYYFLHELTEDKAVSFGMARAKVPQERSGLVGSAHKYHTKTAAKNLYLKDAIHPYMVNYIKEYVKRNYDEFEHFVSDIYKEYHKEEFKKEPATATIASLEEFEELTDTHFKSLLNKILAVIANREDLSKDDISSAIQTIKILKDKFEVRNLDDRTIIEIPSPFSGICQHCNREV